MKTKISRIGKSSLSVILSIMMIISTMLVGTLSANAANGTVTVYFKNTVNWSNVYLYMYTGSYWNDNGSGSQNIAGGPYGMTKVPGTTDVYFYTYTGNYSQYIAFTKDSQPNYGNFHNTEAVYRTDFSTSKTMYTPSTAPNPTNKLNENTVTYYNSGTWSTYSTSSEDTIDADLLSVLKGEKIMFYAGVNWTTSVGLFDKMVTASGTTAKYSKTADKSLSANGNTYNFALFTVPQATYYIGTLDYAPREVATVAGGTYLLANSKITATGFSLAHQWDYDGNWLHSYSASGANSTANVSCDTEISKGSTLSVTNNTAAGKSTIGKTNTFEYYILNKSNNKFTKVSRSSGKIDTSSLEVGNYTLKTVLKDENGLYVVAASNDFSVKELTKYTVKVEANTGGSITAPSGGSATVDAGTKLTITASPDNGFKFKKWTANSTSAGFSSSADTEKASTTVTINGNVTLTASFDLDTPTVSLNAGASTAYIGNSVNLTPSVTKYSEITYSDPSFTVKKGSTTLNASDYIEGNTFKTPTNKDAKGTYTVTVSYTASKDGFTTTTGTSASKTITVSLSAYQTAFETITTKLADTANYPDPSTIIDKYKKSTYDAYNAAYTAASSAVNGKPYPAASKGASDPDYVTLSTNLINAKAALVAKQVLPQPALTADPAYITSGTYSTLTISNYNQYPDGTVFEFYKTTDSTTPIATVTKSDTATGATSISGTPLSMGTHTYYVKVKAYDTDNYTCSNTQSANISIEKKTGITVSVTAGENGSAYISKYTDLSGTVKNNTDPSLTSVSILSGTNVTFTAVPDANYEVSKWNGTESTDKTFTLSNVTTSDTNVSVEFAKSKDVYFYIAVSHNWSEGSHPDVSGASKVGTTYIYQKSLYNGTSEINGFDKKFKVYIYKAVEGASVRIGASDYGQNVTPKSGACYYYGMINNSNGFGTIPAMTLTEVKATSSAGALVKGSQATLSVTASAHNGKTAGQDDYTVHYKVTKDGVVVHNGTAASFTPSESGSYVVEAYAVGKTSDKISTDTVKNTITVYDELPSFKVEFGSSNTAAGTVTATAGDTSINSGDTVVAGTQVSFTYTIKDTSKYDFIGWYDNPQGTGNALATYKPYTFNIKADTKVYAVFGGKKSNYRLARQKGSTYEDLGSFRATDNANEYVLSVDLKEGEKFNFYIETTGTGTPTPDHADKSGDYFKNTNFGTGNSLDMYHWGDGAPCPEFEAVAAGTYVFTWKLDRDNGGTLSVVRPVSDRVTVYAKDGTIPKAAMDDKNLRIAAAMAHMTVESGYIKDTLGQATELENGFHIYAQVFQAEKGSTIKLNVMLEKIEDSNGTEIDANAKYYVKAFCINGKSYGILADAPSEAEAAKNGYSLTYTIPDDFEGDRIEITPIYFRRDDSKCIDIYVLGFDETVQNTWGDTLACYAWYDSDDLAGMGQYPGRPLICEGGRYYTQIPKKIIDDNGKEANIQGILLNNYNNDLIHITPGNINRQTYDFDSFKRLAEKDGVDRVGFSFRRYTGNKNDANTEPFVSETNPNDFKTTINPVEQLKNYYDEEVDIFGNPLTEEGKKKAPLAVVSVGDTNKETKNYIGQFSTDWHVYAFDDGKWVKKGFMPPSAFLFDTYADFNTVLTDAKKLDKSDRMTDYQKCYKAIAGTATRAKYADRPVYITFDQAYDYGDGTFRSDGRWLNTVKNHDITANIEIEYADKMDGDFIKDEFIKDADNKYTDQGTATQAHAHFTNNDDAATSMTVVNNPDKYFTFEADKLPVGPTGIEYYFVGWYLKTEDPANPGKFVYTKLTEPRAPMSASDTYVARYIPASSDEVRVYHLLDETEGHGYADCYAQVDVYDGNPNEGGTLVRTYNETSDVITLSKNFIKLGTNYYLKITLKSVTKGKDTFNKCAVSYNSTDVDRTVLPLVGEGDQKTIVYDKSSNGATIVRLLKVTDDFFDANSKQKTSRLYYYTSVDAVNTAYKINYMYTSRTQGAKTYVAKGDLNGVEYEKYVTADGKLTEEFLIKKAPYQDNFIKTIRWDFGNAATTLEGNRIKVDVEAVTSMRTARVNAFDIENDIFRDPVTVKYGELVKYENLVNYTGSETKGYLYTAPDTHVDPEDNIEKAFSYWGIYTDKECKNLVAKCYSKKFNYVVYDNYYIKPVYEGRIEEIKDRSTTISLLDYSRNQWTDDEGNKTASTDKVYADFALAYEHMGDILKDTNNANVKCGMFFEMCGILKTDSNGKYITNLESYKNDEDYATSEADLRAIEQAILGQTDYSRNKTLRYTTEKNSERKLLYKNIALGELDNKNRIEYYIGYNNSEGNQKQLLKAYSYIMYDSDGDGSIDAVKLCETPVVFVNYYEVGNRIYTIG